MESTSCTDAAALKSADVRNPPYVSSEDLPHIAAMMLATALQVVPPARRSRVLRQLSALAARAWQRANGGTSLRVRRYLQELFDLTEPDALSTALHIQLRLAAWNALIVNLLPSLSDRDVVGVVSIAGLDHLEAAAQAARPIVLLGAHYGAYGYAVTAALTAQGHPACLIGYGGSESAPPGSSRFYRRFYWPRIQRLQDRLPIVIVAPGEPAQPELVQLLEHRTHLLYVLPDQYFVQSNVAPRPAHLVAMSLLNRRVWLDTTPLRLAKEREAQLFTALPLPEGTGTTVQIEPLSWAGDGLETAALQQDLSVYLRRLEDRLQSHPALWRDLRRKDLLQRLSVPNSLEFDTGIDQGREKSLVDKERSA